MAEPVHSEGAAERPAPLRWRSVLAISLGVAMASGAYLLLDAAPATLRIETGASFDVSVDGVARGATPLVLTLPAGDHSVTIGAPGFVESRRTVSLDGGRETRLEARPRIADPDDPAALSRLGSEFGLSFAAEDRLAISRGYGDSMEMLLPRGDVRLEDLTTYRTVANEEWFDVPGTIEFRRGKEVLYAVPYELKNMLPEVTSFPVAARAALKPGDVVTWGFFPTKPERRHRPVLATFRLVDVDLSTKLRDLAVRLADQPVALMPVFRAKYLMGKGLYTAAIAEIEGATAKDANAARAWAVELQCLSHVGLETSWMRDDVDRKIDRLADGVRAKVFTPRR